ncbi:hypothetical protein D3C87_653190 [compost metagenome]
MEQFFEVSFQDDQLEQAVKQILQKNDNSTFVPVRFVSDFLESSVEYMANPKTVLIFEKK